MAIEDAGFEIRDMLGWIYTQSQVKAFSQNHIIDNHTQDLLHPLEEPIL